MAGVRGLVLLVVVGVLGVLMVFAVAFVTITQLERKASQQRLCATKALFLARSGLEDAMARLSAGQDPETDGNRYRGEDWNADGVLNAGPEEAGGEVYRPGRLDTDACPVADALRPSFFRVAGGNPGTLSVDGRLRGYSGRLAGDAYSLKVSSCEGLYVNGGDPTAPASAGYNAVLRRILGNLAEALDRERLSQMVWHEDDEYWEETDVHLAADDADPVDQTDGWKLVDLRPADGWRSWEQVRDLALGGSQAKVDALRPYLALHAWVDRKVVAPNASPALEGRSYSSWADLKLDRTPGVSGSRAPDFERIGGRIVGRAPVSLAWASSRYPVLVALTAGLKGLYLDESSASPIAQGDLVGTLRATAELPCTWDLQDDAHVIAQSILDSRWQAWSSWQAWDEYCESLPLGVSCDEVSEARAAYNQAVYLYHDDPTPARLAAMNAAASALSAALAAFPAAQAKRDLLKANFNPNSDLNKCNPCAPLWRAVDKSDLLAYSTEFALLGSPLCEVESLGRVLDGKGRLMASATLRSTLSTAERCRLTTQKEFVCEDLGRLDVAGDETAPRVPGGSGPFVSASAGLTPTWGQALPGLGGRGAGLQTYPEPCVDDGTGLALHPADYDGSLQLATVETAVGDLYGVSGTPAQEMKCLTHFDTSMDLDLFHDAAGGANQTDLLQVARGELGRSLFDAAKPNTLYPDGCYSEKDRAPSFLDKGNAHPYHGMLSFWIKLNHGDPVGSVLRGHPYVIRTNFSTGGYAGGFSPDQFFFLGHAFQRGTVLVAPSSNLVQQFEIGHNTSDVGNEHRHDVPRSTLPHRWCLYTTCWDFGRASNQGTWIFEAGAVVVDDGVGFGNSDTYSGINDWTLASDITQDDRYGPHRTSLGGGRPAEELDISLVTGSGADATLDEFAIWDFGDGGTDAHHTCPQTWVLASTRYKEGRYYKESDYAGLTASAGMNKAGQYFSPPIRLGVGARILGLSWSQNVPRGLRGPLEQGRRPGLDGDNPPDGRIVFELADAAGTDYLRNLGGRAVDRLFINPALSPVGEQVGVPFRLHAVFQPNLDPATMQDSPLIEPMVLDDVTVTYRLPGGVRLLAWDRP